MRWLNFGVCLTAVLTLASAAGTDKAEEGAAEHVVVLTQDTFDKFVTDNPVSLIEFYAPWCGHCKKLAPEYEKAAEISKRTLGVPLAKVDATEEKDLAQKFEIQGFPTIHLFRQGKAEPYTGGRTADKIVEWLELATGPAVATVGSVEEAAKITVENKLKIVGYFHNNKSSEFETFASVADENRGAGKFIAIVNAALEKNNVVTLEHKSEDALEHKLTTKDDFNTFLNVEKFPLLGTVNGETYSKYSERSDSWVWFAGDVDALEKYGSAIRKVSRNYRADYNFVFLDIKEFEGHAKSGLGMETFPSIAIQNPEGRYLYNDEISEKKLTKFIEAVRAGKIEKHLKSEPIPETNDADVKIVVGKNFEEIVLDDTKDVLLEIYAPWCGHCKQLQPIYEEFAKSARSSKSLVIAKMDGTANEPPVKGFDFHGFPTLYFIPAGDKRPLTYDGARTVDGFTEYVKKHAKVATSFGDAGAKDEL